MILEGLVTTVDTAGRLNVAPMGPRVGPDMGRFLIRPFRSSTTYRNLKATGEGVFHVTDDVLLLARAAIATVEDAPVMRAERVRGFVLTGACRAYEFAVKESDDSAERATFTAETLLTRHLRDFFGFNRAKHAVLEAAILATRVGLIPLASIESELQRLRTPVEKTGGDDERQAFALLAAHIAAQSGRAKLAQGEPVP